MWLLQVGCVPSSPGMGARGPAPDYRLSSPCLPHPTPPQFCQLLFIYVAIYAQHVFQTCPGLSSGAGGQKKRIWAEKNAHVSHL